VIPGREKCLWMHRSFDQSVSGSVCENKTSYAVARLIYFLVCWVDMAANGEADVFILF
jgi:hypothetical protein